MSLIDTIIKLKPREEAGSKTSRKYHFQKDLSLFLMIERHVSASDYLFLFDLHEDLIILNSSTLPTKANFYQIKSKDGNGFWTLNTLTKCNSGKSSIIGKLYLNKLTFPASTESLNFISNARFNFSDLKDKSDSKTLNLIYGKNLNSNDIIKVDKKIREELQLHADSNFEKLTNFHVTSLSNTDSSTHCIGKLNRLINSINPDNKINAELAYKQIINEIVIKTGNTISATTINNLSELIILKGISKDMFLKYLEQAGLYKSIDDEWGEIKQSLEACSIGYKELMKFKSGWREMRATLIKDSNSIPLNHVIDTIKSLIQIKMETLTNRMSLLEIINHIFPHLPNALYDEYFTKCLIIKQLNED